MVRSRQAYREDVGNFDKSFEGLAAGNSNNQEYPLKLHVLGNGLAEKKAWAVSLVIEIRRFKHGA